MDFQQLIGELVAWLLGAGEDWAPIIQAVAAVASLAVAFVAIKIARQAQHAEETQASAATAALTEARRSEVARQREAQVLSISPLLPDRWSFGVHAGHYKVSAAIRPHGDYPLINGSITARGRMETGIGSWTGDFGSVIPASGEVRIVVEVDVLLTPDTPVHPYGEYWEMVVEYWGVLGQRVVEHYEFLPQRWLNGDSGIVTRLYRLEVITSVPGADAVDYPFGEPFRDPDVVPMSPAG